MHGLRRPVGHDEYGGHLLRHSGTTTVNEQSGGPRVQQGAIQVATPDFFRVLPNVT